MISFIKRQKKDLDIGSELVLRIVLSTLARPLLVEMKTWLWLLDAIENVTKISKVFIRTLLAVHRGLSNKITWLSLGSYLTKMHSRNFWATSVFQEGRKTVVKVAKY